MATKLEHFELRVKGKVETFKTLEELADRYKQYLAINKKPSDIELYAIFSDGSYTEINLYI